MAPQAPAFNYPAESRRRFCADHKLEGMVNLRKKRARSDIELQIAAAGAHPSQARLLICLRMTTSAQRALLPGTRVMQLMAQGVPAP